MNFHDCVEIGFPGVRLLDGFKQVQFEGGSSVQIEAMHGLLEAVLRSICQSGRELHPDMIRIIRQYLSLSQTQLATAFDLSDRQMVGKYEKGQVSLPSLAQRELKRLLLTHLEGGRVSLKAFETFMNTRGPEVLEFSFEDGRWIWANSPHAESSAFAWSKVAPKPVERIERIEGAGTAVTVEPFSFRNEGVL